MLMSDNRLKVEQIEKALDEQLEAVLSSRRNARGPAHALARFERSKQDFVLRWVGVIAKTNAELRCCTSPVDRLEPRS